MAIIMMMFVLPVLSILPAGGADTLTTFSGGNPSANLDFGAGGGVRNVTITLPNDATVTAASFDINGLETSPGGGFPTDVRVDVGEDGTYEWAFEGTGIGHLGNQPMLSDGEVDATVTFTAPTGGVDTARSIFIPKEASIKDAHLDISGNGTAHVPVLGPVMNGNIANSLFGYNFTKVGDVNNDGWEDVVIGAPLEAKARLYHGGPDLDGQADLVMMGSTYFGWAVAGLGDVNNDDIDDFAVSELNTTRIYFGGPSLDAVADLNLTGDAPDPHYFGVSVAGGSDLDGDSYPDIVVGDYLSTADWQGRVYVFKGGPGLDATFDYSFNGTVGVSFGLSLATGGDLDNDGQDDLVIATPSCYWDFVEGKISIYKGGSGFGASEPIANISTSIGGEVLGLSMAIDGDLNGDGIDDLIVGGPNNGAGKVYIYMGRATWPASPPPSSSLTGEEQGSRFGNSVAYAGDMDNDGKSEIIVGSPKYDEGGKTDCGKTYLINGSSIPSYSDAYEYLGSGSSSWSGRVVRGLGDIDGDGDTDFAIAAPSNNSDRGTVAIYRTAYGLVGAKVSLGGVAMDPMKGASVLNGTFSTFIPVSGLQAAIDTAPVANTDIHGNRFVELQVRLEAAGPGNLTLTNISINYTLDTSSVMSLEDAINAYLEDARASGIPGEVVVVPIAVSSSSAGRVALSDLLVEYTKNQPPVAIIDFVNPSTIEAGGLVLLSGHGEDDGDIVAVNWSSDKEGILGYTETVEVTLGTIGVHTITFMVMDDKGIWSRPNTTTVTVVEPNVAPTVTIVRPEWGAVVHGEVLISGNATDSNAADTLEVELNVDGRGWEPVTGVAPWTYVWDTSSETDGIHNVTARASDGKLYSPLVSVHLEVIHPVPGISISGTSIVEAYPGDVVELSFAVNNTGTGEGTFSLFATTDPSVPATLSDRALTLGPGDGGNVSVEVTIGDKTAPGTTYQVTLSVKEDYDPSVSDAFTTLVSVIDRPPDPTEQSIVLEVPDGGLARPKGSLVYYFNIRNMGTAGDTYDITVTSANDWEVSLVVNGAAYTSGVQVGTGGSATLDVTVTVPRGARPGSTDTLKVEVVSRGFPPLIATGSVVTTVQAPPASTGGVIEVPMVPIVASVVILVAVGVTVGGTEWGRYGFFWLLIPLYSRLKKEMVLDNFKRGEINAFIKLNPGTYYNEIKKYLDVSNGVLTYHLNKLESEGYVQSKMNGRYKHYFPANMRVPKRIMVLNEIHRALINYIREYGPVTQAHISETLDIPLPSVSRHLRKLTEAEMIKVDRDGNLNYYSLAAPTVQDQGNTIGYENEQVFARTPPPPEY